MDRNTHREYVAPRVARVLPQGDPHIHAHNRGRTTQQPTRVAPQQQNDDSMVHIHYHYHYCRHSHEPQYARVTRSRSPYSSRGSSPDRDRPSRYRSQYNRSPSRARSTPAGPARNHRYGTSGGQRRRNASRGPSPPAPGRGRAPRRQLFNDWESITVLSPVRNLDHNDWEPLEEISQRRRQQVRSVSPLVIFTSSPDTSGSNSPQRNTTHSPIHTHISSSQSNTPHAESLTHNLDRMTRPYANPILVEQQLSVNRSATTRIENTRRDTRILLLDCLITVQRDNPRTVGQGWFKLVRQLIDNGRYNSEAEVIGAWTYAFLVDFPRIHFRGFFFMTLTELQTMREFEAL